MLPLRDITCLVMEDDRNIAELLRTVLTYQGADVTVVGDASEARVKILDGTFDVFVLDVMVPDGNGYSLLREVRSLGVDTPALFLTAKAEHEDLITGLSAGAMDYILKPFSIQDVTNRVAELVGGVRDSMGVGVVSLASDGPANGDWWDVVDTGNGKALIVLDASGHGPEAHIRLLPVLAGARDRLMMGWGPGKVLAGLAQDLGSTEESFITGAIAVVGEEEIEYASAGHPSLIVRHSNGECERLRATGPILGPFPGEWEEVRFGLETGDIVVMFSDGLIESRDNTGTVLGLGLLEVLKTMPDYDAQKQAEWLCQTALSYQGRALPQDDTTILVLHV